MQSLPRLGVALLYQPALSSMFHADSTAVDAVAVDLDPLWVDRGNGHRPRYLENLTGTATVRSLAHRWPVIPRGAGLSIGSGCQFDVAWLGQLRTWHERVPFAWHTDYLAYRVTEWQGQTRHAGLHLPLPRDAATIEMLIPRIRQVLAGVPTPFLLRNVAQHFLIAETEMDEPDFMNQICHRSGAGLTLDLQALFTSSVNHAYDARAWLQALDLALVGEIVVAGGRLEGDWYVDSRDDAISEPVWNLLEYALPRCPHIGAVTMEMDAAGMADVGQAQLGADLRRLRLLWNQCVASQRAAALPQMNASDNGSVKADSVVLESAP